jgi:hypothetical protein
MLRISHQKGQWSLRFAYISFRFQCDIFDFGIQGLKSGQHGTEISQVCELLSSVGWNASNASSIHHDSPWFTWKAQVESGRADASARSRLSCISFEKKTHAGATGLEACLEAWEKMHLQCFRWKTEGWEENAIIYIYYIIYIILYIYDLLYDICKQIDITGI